MTRLRIALVSLAVALSMFAPAAARPVVAEETQLTAAVFAFDFSGSIYCYYKGKSNPACSDPINEALAAAVDQLATNISNTEAQFEKRAIDFKVTKFGSNGTFAPVVANGENCSGNTKNETKRLVACLREIARQYKLPEYELGGTAFSQVFSGIEQYSSDDRCGLILFTDGKPDENDKKRAENLSKVSNCSVLPVSSGVEKEIDVKWLEGFTQVEMTPLPECEKQGDFEWSTVYFESPQEAVSAIGRALSEIACLKQVPSRDQCLTVDQTKAWFEAEGLAVVLGPKVIGSEFPVGLPLAGEYVARDGGITILESTPTLPSESCAPTPTPTATPTPTPIPTLPPPPPLPCMADSPLSWLGCNPWALLLLLLLVGARLWWIGRDLQVSINGQEAVALRGGTKVGFDLHNGNAERTPNPNDAQVKITRAFFRFFPGTRLDTSGLTGEVGGKPSKFELGKELDLASGASAVVRYGNPRPYQDSSNPDETAPSDFSGTSQGGGSSSAL
jgi:hypothetical protein